MSDTTPVANDQLPHSHRFVNSCFAWLLGVGSNPAGWVAVLWTLLGCAVVLGLALWHGEALVTCCGCLAVSLSMLALRPQTVRLAELPYEGRIGYVDVVHCPNVPTDSGLTAGLAGLKRSLFRAGYMPIDLHRGLDPRWARNGAYFLISPRRRLGPADALAITRYAEAGGVVVCCCGPQDRGTAEAVLSAAGVVVTDVPLGPIAIQRYEGAKGIAFNTAFQLLPSRPDTEVILETEGRALAVRRTCGAGEIVVIGDPGFFGNSNLETGGEYLPGNVIFLKQLLDRRFRK